MTTIQEFNAIKADNQALNEDLEFRIEFAKIHFAEQIVKLMDSQGINKVNLADKLGSSPSFITKILSGENNFTLETMTKVGIALRQRLEITFKPVHAAKNPQEYICQSYTNVRPPSCPAEPTPKSAKGSLNDSSVIAAA